MLVNCHNCQKTFNKPPSQVRKRKRVFCSVPCANNAQTVHQAKPCEVCGEAFRTRNLHRYATCPKPECRAEKKRLGHEAQKKPGTKSKRRHAGKGRENVYFNNLKYLYGISKDEYAAMKERQNQACAICKIPSQKRLVVDHCHTTGAVRGLLCDKCNFGIGLLRESPDVLRSAIAYLCQEV